MNQEVMMAGATANVLLPDVWSDAHQAALTAYIEQVASSVEGQSFWIVGQPLSWEFDTQDDALELQVDVLGWVPKTAISFCAMRRGVVADAYLGMVVARVAQMFDGVVAFGGRIAWYADDAATLTLEGCYHSDEEDILSPEYLQYWLGHPKFQMVN